ncbi:MAG: hypothetical protein DMF56_07580 [Acidobacteria bacterium]|nr:MAG: hypothetical protein DMF56_07580 [Acidobacteriota bacterium]
MNLQHLRDDCPLTEFDFAAVRARVRSEIARRQQRRAWVFRFASAFVAAALAVLALIPSQPPQAPSGVTRAAFVVTAAPSGYTVRSTVAAATSGGVTAGGSGHHKVHRHHVKELTPQVAVSRIEIHTADPDVRIIWIVPKENS